MYKRPWTLRHEFKYEEDAFLVEFLFVLSGGLICGLAFVTSPQAFEVVPYSVDLSSDYWDIPLVYLLPFLIFKMSDYSSQIPYRLVENPWVFPLEAENPETWPWRDLMQVNFEIKRSLLDEYNIFSWSARPWIESPKEVSLGKIFRLAMQERRQRKDLSSIQDMGDEYDGTPRFCWIFSFKRIWYNPATWFRQPRFVNPDLSLKQNKIRKGDIIVARRIPGDGTKPSGINYENMLHEDDDKTVIVKR